MATFNQQGQTVQKQYNAETINFGEVRTPDNFLLKLKSLQAELNKAIDAKAIPDENAKAAEAQVKKAILQAENTTPDKKSLIEHLKTAKDLVSSVDGLVVAFTSAIAIIGTLF